MAKRFKLKMSRVFSSCRSKDPSDLPSNPVPSFFRLSSVNPNSITLHLPPQPQPQPQQPTTSSKLPHCSSLKRHVSSAFSSIGCGLRSRSPSAKLYLSETDRTESPTPPTPEFHWEKEDRWHVIAKVYGGDDDDDDDETPRRKIYNTSGDDLFPPPPPPNTEKKKRRCKKKKTTPKVIRISTSSADSGLFSSESFDDEYINDEETETLVSSSRSFSTDSSSETFNANLQTIRETTHKKKKRNKKANNKKAKRQANAKRLSSSSTESESPARLSSFLQRMIPCTVDGRVRESFVVVKKSEDPYEDFRRSMMEMILEKQMFEDKDLEQLLNCFLSLNSRHHHGVIVQAFTEIWEALFSPTSTSFRVSCALNY